MNLFSTNAICKIGYRCSIYRKKYIYRTRRKSTVNETLLFFKIKVNSNFKLFTAHANEKKGKPKIVFHVAFFQLTLFRKQIDRGQYLMVCKMKQHVKHPPKISLFELRSVLALVKSVTAKFV